jgi:hypothetical protein
MPLAFNPKSQTYEDKNQAKNFERDRKQDLPAPAPPTSGGLSAPTGGGDPAKPGGYLADKTMMHHFSPANIDRMGSTTQSFNRNVGVGIPDDPIMQQLQAMMGGGGGGGGGGVGPGRQDEDLDASREGIGYSDMLENLGTSMVGDIDKIFGQGAISTRVGEKTQAMSMAEDQINSQFANQLGSPQHQAALAQTRNQYRDDVNNTIDSVNEQRATFSSNAYENIFQKENALNQINAQLSNADADRKAQMLAQRRQIGASLAGQKLANKLGVVRTMMDRENDVYNRYAASKTEDARNFWAGKEWSMGVGQFNRNNQESDRNFNYTVEQDKLDRAERAAAQKGGFMKSLGGIVGGVAGSMLGPIGGAIGSKLGGMITGGGG